MNLPKTQRKLSRVQESATGANNSATEDERFQSGTGLAYQTQFEALQELCGSEIAWLFELDVEGRGDCWAFSIIACARPTTLHMLHTYFSPPNAEQTLCTH